MARNTDRHHLPGTKRARTLVLSGMLIGLMTSGAAMNIAQAKQLDAMGSDPSNSMLIAARGGGGGGGRQAASARPSTHANTRPTTAKPQTSTRNTGKTTGNTANVNNANRKQANLNSGKAAGNTANVNNANRKQANLNSGNKTVNQNVNNEYNRTVQVNGQGNYDNYHNHHYPYGAGAAAAVAGYAMGSAVNNLPTGYQTIPVTGQPTCYYYEGAYFVQNPQGGYTVVEPATCGQ